MAEKNKGRHQLGVLALFILACELAGILGSFFTMQSIPTWYATLIKPSFSPPNWLFAPAWTLLYALMGTAAYLVWEKRQGAKNKMVGAALNMFCIQLVLNALWSVVFFGLRSPGFGLIEIFVLWFAILITILQFLKVSRWAAWLMTPYLLWVSFACGLNLGIFLLNK